MKKPYFELSKKKLFENYKNLKKYCDTITYSFKTNNLVGNILEENFKECYFSVHSINEIKNMKIKKNINFFLLGTFENELKILFEKYNIKNFIIDNLQDLKILLDYIKKNNKKINLSLRCKICENTMSHGKHYYFGMNLNIVKENILKLSKNKNINKIGLHIHRKTQNVNEWRFDEEIFENIENEVLEKISTFNIGGGIPSKYKNIDDETINNILQKILSFKKKLNKKNIKLLIEPGRLLSANCIKLISNIKLIGKKTIFLDVSIFNGCMDTIIANIKLLVENEVEKSQYKYLLKGNSPDSCDILRYSVYFNKPINKDDKIIFLNSGAYNYQTDFFSLEKIETKIL